MLYQSLCMLISVISCSFAVAQQKTMERPQQRVVAGEVVDYRALPRATLDALLHSRCIDLRSLSSSSRGPITSTVTAASIMAVESKAPAPAPVVASSTPELLEEPKPSFLMRLFGRWGGGW